MVKRIFPWLSSIVMVASRILDQALHLADGLARHDHAGHAAGPVRQGKIDLRQAMAVGGDAAQGRGFGGARAVQVDAVQIVAGFLGRDRKLRAVDQPLHVGSGQRKRVRHLACGQVREIALRQGLQREARAAGADGEHGAVAGRLQHDLRSFRQLAHDVVQHVRRHRGRATVSDFRSQRLGDFEIEVGRFQAEAGIFRPQKHVAEDGNRVAAFDNAMNVSQRFEKLRALDGDLHYPKPA